MGFFFIGSCAPVLRGTKSRVCISPTNHSSFLKPRRFTTVPLILHSANRAMTMAVGDGDTAPDFEVEKDDGGKVSLKSLNGKKVVLFFYPKASTSGCTKESAAFQERLGEFSNANCQVIGASRDTPQDQTKFKNDLGLKYPLLCDQEGSLTESYGVWKLRKKFGREFMGIERSTFVIDEEGKIAKSWRDVKVDGHVDEVIKAVKAT